MKLYLLSPAFDVPDSGRHATQPYLDTVADVIARALRPTGDESILGVWHSTEATMGGEPFDAEYADKRVRELRGQDLLRSVLRRIADPWDAYFMWVRCQTTCRWAFFGHDAQAFLCLRHEDVPPPASALIEVEECTALLAETDFFDG